MERLLEGGDESEELGAAGASTSANELTNNAEIAIEVEDGSSNETNFHLKDEGKVAEELSEPATSSSVALQRQRSVAGMNYNLSDFESSDSMDEVGTVETNIDADMDSNTDADVLMKPVASAGTDASTSATSIDINPIMVTANSSTHNTDTFQQASNCNPKSKSNQAFKPKAKYDYPVRM